jgi:hypothetical protein
MVDLKKLVRQRKMKSLFSYANQSLDITGAEDVEISIRNDGKVIWVNTVDGCVLRICQISGRVIVDDKRIS